MPSKITILRLSLFLLATAIGSTGFGADTTQFFTMTQTLNEQWNERILQTLKTPNRQFSLNLSTQKFRFTPNFWLFHDCGSWNVMDIPKPKFRFSDPFTEINEAFLSCTSLRITTIETTTLVAPHLAGILKDDLFNGFLIQNRSETTDTYAALVAYKLLTQYLQPDEDPYFEVGEESLEKEIEEFKPASIPPSIIFEFEGKNWIQVKLYFDSGSAVIRSKDKWTSYTFDKYSAAIIKSRLTDLHTLYATSSLNN